MGPILYAHEHKYKIFILQALSTISTCAYIRDFTVRNVGTQKGSDVRRLSTIDLPTCQLRAVVDPLTYGISQTLAMAEFKVKKFLPCVILRRLCRACSHRLVIKGEGNF